MNKQVVYVIGIGPGSTSYLVGEAKEILEQVDVIIGAKRMIELANRLIKSQKVKTFAAYLPTEIREILNKQTDCKCSCILMSGDSGFYSGAKKIVEQLTDYEIRLIPGIASISYISAKIKVPWSDMKILSHHGKSTNLIHAIEHNRWVFAILSGKEDCYRLGEKLSTYHMEEVRLYIGENLSYENEQIRMFKPEEIANHTFDSLLVVVVENPYPKEENYFEMADEDFIRGQVPMTKAEIRTISIAKLHLSKEAIFYDIGAGTGSISVQVGKMYPENKVYAIERNAEAIRLLEANKIKFAVDYMEIIEGNAPEVLEDLPAPTHVLIGGSGGVLEEILNEITKKNPDVKVVIQAITLETQAKVIALCDKDKWKIKEMIHMSVAKTKEIGRYHLLMGQNPISIFVLERRKGL